MEEYKRAIILDIVQLLLLMALTVMFMLKLGGGLTGGLFGAFEGMVFAISIANLIKDVARYNINKNRRDEN